MEAWYLDAVCLDGTWDVVFVQKAGRTVAAMPFFLKQKGPWRYVAMPPLCKFMGPYLLPEYRGIKHETGIYQDLLGQIPTNLAAFEQDSPYQVTNWLPYYWKGFRQTTRYSYGLDLTRSESDLFAAVAKSYRKKIERCKTALQRVHDLPLSELHRLLSRGFERQGLPAPVSYRFLEKLYNTLQTQGAARLFFACNPADGVVHEAALLIWDKRSAYYLLSGSDPEHRRSGAAVWLQWEAICYAKHTLGLPIFDFEGSMMPNIEPGRRDFGAAQLPYFRLQKEWSPLWKIGKWLWR